MTARFSLSGATADTTAVADAIPSMLSQTGRTDSLSPGEDSKVAAPDITFFFLIRGDAVNNRAV